ncbi:putative Helitron-like helicase [Hamiltosporidium tvaerminnensis]|uniref:Putative Helitron-like helicase n=1 Tax=Hamiltosporidium tvaerminnensis TaxID=1176355 RepID=A0A4Q9L0P1_9MICR|nr:putative Helitron-like helicase [Hamiltosporidium tvaerminnensis]
MTCNPNNAEISENIDVNEKRENRPDLVDRVFRQKLKPLMTDIRRNIIFGKVNVYCYVIEFQKRGLPHAHILITLVENYKPRDSALLDKIVSAEISDKNIHPGLFSIITKNMIHGPCGFLSYSSCMVENICSKSFLKKFQEYTVLKFDRYPLYHRRKKNSVKILKNHVYNSWDIPYSPYLSLKYNCHINVDICASFKTVKYLFGYAYKEFDRANISFQFDEIKNHKDSKSVSPHEAVWRIFKFSTHEQSHTVEKLAVYLEREHNIFFHQMNKE